MICFLLGFLVFSKFKRTSYMKACFFELPFPRFYMVVSIFNVLVIWFFRYNKRFMLLADIALIELYRPAFFNNRVVVPCMPNEGSYPPKGKKCVVAGNNPFFLFSWFLPSISKAKDLKTVTKFRGKWRQNPVKIEFLAGMQVKWGRCCSWWKIIRGKTKLIYRSTGRSSKM